ncbi:aminotransferase [Heterosigma akashiwo virus 01]|uniref:NifS-like protein n=1 Tax=Heterosigma akashiwo virus 01 TaxID=97195 RepID=A0A1C9C5E2_HAV01|nr:aminotransferase [Heterosigma akashiwo virus 01]AOM63503.1 aminotransferase [Heterosigma akashiwo virus 01]
MTIIDTPYGKKELVLADCTGSGEFDEEVDEYMKTKVLPYYCNVHSDNHCAYYMGKLIALSRKEIKTHCCSTKYDDYAVIFTGNGATCAARHLGHLINYNVDYLIMSVIEHHSNSLLWKSIFDIKEDFIVDVNAKTGMIDTKQLKKVLDNCCKDSSTKAFVAMSVCSNVTGVVQDIKKISSLVKQYTNAILCMDFACSSPYRKMEVSKHDIDAAVLSPHKFKGGYSTPGILIVKKSLIKNSIPFFPGGGTVCYCDSKSVKFLENIEYREEGGTPNIIGVIKTGYLFKRKCEKINSITKRTKQLIKKIDPFFRKLKRTGKIKMITPISTSSKNTKNIGNRLPIYSFIVNDAHPNFIVRLLSDLFGIQVRGGIACCSLLAEKISKPCNEMKKMISSMKGVPKEYGWIRVSFYYDNEDEHVDYVTQCLTYILSNWRRHLGEYTYIAKYNNWVHKLLFKKNIMQYN